MHNHIAQQRREVFLKEIIQETLSNLYDEILNTLEVTQVQCSKGKYDAKIFIESSSFTHAQRQEILKAFKRARAIIQQHILHVSSWHNAPKLTLCFDDSLQYQNRLDAIFARISHKQNTIN